MNRGETVLGPLTYGTGWINPAATKGRQSKVAAPQGLPQPRRQLVVSSAIALRACSALRILTCVDPPLRSAPGRCAVLRFRVPYGRPAQCRGPNLCLRPVGCGPTAATPLQATTRTNRFA